MSKFFKDNKTAQSRGCLLQQIALEIMLLLVDNAHEKISQKIKTDAIFKECARYM